MKNSLLCNRLSLLLSLVFSVTFWSTCVADEDLSGEVLANQVNTKRVMRLEVIDPYVELHTGPGRGYPVFYVIEQGERVDVLTRRPGWYEVRAQNGRTGWTTAAQISRTLQPTGEPADLPTVGFGDYLKNRWRVGFSAGQFTSGELDGADTFNVAGGYRPLPWLGLSFEYGFFFDADIKGELYNFNILLEPFSQWRLSPVLLLGRGRISVDSQPELTPLEIDTADFNTYGLGINYYLGRNFIVKGEYRDYSVLADNGTVTVEAWLIGFNTFF